MEVGFAAAEVDDGACFRLEMAREGIDFGECGCILLWRFGYSTFRVGIGFPLLFLFRPPQLLLTSRSARRAPCFDLLDEDFDGVRGPAGDLGSETGVIGCEGFRVGGEEGGGVGGWRGVESLIQMAETCGDEFGAHGGL